MVRSTFPIFIWAAGQAASRDPVLAISDTDLVITPY